jgi:hypothetical protein
MNLLLLVLRYQCIGSPKNNGQLEKNWCLYKEKLIEIMEDGIYLVVGIKKKKD